jgi:hypothetical protein
MRTVLSFRGIVDPLAVSHLEGFKYYPTHVDNPFSSAGPIYINSNVHVAYSADTYGAVHSGDFPLSPLGICIAL